MRFYTEQHKDITPLVEKGLTTIFEGTDMDTLLKAKSFARKKRRYQYPVLVQKNNKMIPYGFGIPK